MGSGGDVEMGGTTSVPPSLRPGQDITTYLHGMTEELYDFKNGGRKDEMLLMY